MDTNALSKSRSETDTFRDAYQEVIAMDTKFRARV